LIDNNYYNFKIRWKNRCDSMPEDIKKFQIIGIYKKERKEYPFKQTIIAQSENYAIHKLYSRIGSRHKVKRYNIKIEEVNMIE